MAVYDRTADCGDGRKTSDSEGTLQNHFGQTEMLSQLG